VFFSRLVTPAERLLSVMPPSRTKHHGVHVLIHAAHLLLLLACCSCICMSIDRARLEDGGARKETALPRSTIIHTIPYHHDGSSNSAQRLHTYNTWRAEQYPWTGADAATARHCCAALFRSMSSLVTAVPDGDGPIHATKVRDGGPGRAAGSRPAGRG
jgi:hypothetical protein